RTDSVLLLPHARSAAAAATAAASSLPPQTKSLSSPPNSLHLRSLRHDMLHFSYRLSRSAYGSWFMARNIGLKGAKEWGKPNWCRRLPYANDLL
uniref:Uncharacterized protein n=1 Tax=Triticum urartu TaxID=4572 RepID=A0A8R7U1Z2_TRIUA